MRILRIISARVAAADGSEVDCRAEVERLVEHLVERKVKVERAIEVELSAVIPADDTTPTNTEGMPAVSVELEPPAELEEISVVELEVERLVAEEDIRLDRSSPDEHWQALAAYRRAGGEIAAAATVIAAARYANAAG